MTYAAIYIKKDNKVVNPIDAVQSAGIKAELTQAFSNAKTSLQNFDLSKMAQNINLQSATEFTQKYAVGALTMIINQRPVTNQMMLDSLFNGLAPALNLTAAQAGFNSIMEMKSAIESGNINVANFMQGLENGLDVVTGTITGSQDYSKYGEEIPIDLTSNITRTYIAETPDRRVQSGQTYNEYVHNLPLVLPFSGIVKDGLNYTADEFADRLEEIMYSKEPFTFRAGEKIFENYVFTSFTPKRETENGVQFDAEIKFMEEGDVEYVKVNITQQSTAKGTGAGLRKQVTNTKKGQSVKNNTSPQKYAGAVGFVNSILGGDGVTNLQLLNSITNNLNSYR